jgi:hypothetical protein
MAFDPINDLERSLVKASTDPVHRPQFYRDFMGAKIFAVEHGAVQHGTEHRELRAGASLELRTWQREGVTVVPIFSSLARLQTFLTDAASYLEMDVPDFLQMTRGANLMLNPGSEYGKEFTSAEITSLLDGSLWRPTESYVVKKETKVLIGQPARYPTELVALLTRFFQSSPEVRRAYLVLFHDVERSEKPHLLIALEVANDWDRIAAGAGLIARDVVVADPPIDFVQIKGNEQPFGKGVEPFYEMR